MAVTNLPIASKVLALLGAMALLTIGATLFSTGQMRGIDRTYGGLLEHQAKATVLLARANRALVGSEVAIAALLLSTTEGANVEAIADITRARASFVEFVEGARAADPAQRGRIDTLYKRGLAALDQSCARAIQLGAKATEVGPIMQSQAEYLKTCAPVFKPLVVDVVAAVEAAMREVERGVAEGGGVTMFTVLATYTIVSGGLLLIGIGATLAARAWISRPLRGLTRTMQALSGGELERHVAGAERGDEVGMMARAVQVFRDTGLRLRATKAEARRVAEGQITEIAVSAREQASGLSQVNTATNQMDQVVQQNAAMVEQASAAAGSLTEEAARLKALVGRFVIGAVRTGGDMPRVRISRPASPWLTSASA